MNLSLQQPTQPHTMNNRIRRCPVTHAIRSNEICSTCVECTGGVHNRCGLLTRRGRIIAASVVGNTIDRQKEAEEAFERNKALPRTPRDVANIVDVFEVVHDVLQTLTDREREVISLRFGLVDGFCHTLEYVGEMFNVNRERIRQIEARALRKLRHPARLRRLLDVRA